MNIISPINEQQESLVIDTTKRYIDTASNFFEREFSHIPVSFKLKGRAAGMYHVKNGHRYIRYNPYIFAKYFEDNLQNTVPHEVAHYVADMLYGLKNIRPHGREWQGIMKQFGVEASTHCNYDLQGIPVRQYRHYLYSCQCRTYEISSKRHNMIIKGKRYYHCPQCSKNLVIIE